MKIVEITWEDSTGVNTTWEDRDSKPLDPIVINSVGYLLESNKDFVTICQSESCDQLGRRFSIPRGCIKKIKIIRR
jgi:hypothetical protein